MVLLANKLEVRKKRFSWEKPEEIQTDLQCVNVTSTETYEYCILCFFGVLDLSSFVLAVFDLLKNI